MSAKKLYLKVLNQPTNQPKKMHFEMKYFFQMQALEK